MAIKDKIKNYFRLSEIEKDHLLAEIVLHYRDEQRYGFNGSINIKQLIDWDIAQFTEQEEFELVQALTDIRKMINEIEDEILNGL